MFCIWFFLLALLAIFSVPVFIVGVILRLCEWGWEKLAGSLGSRSFLSTGALLSLPFFIYLTPLLIERLGR